ncbi:MAG: hypothetical protein ACI4TI_04215 [Christensenellales bacterium]
MNTQKENCIIRLLYVSFEKFKDHFSNETKIGRTIGVSSPFKLPKNMTLDDACKVISYLSEKIEAENNLNAGSQKSVALVSANLHKYGFKKINGFEHGYYHAIGTKNAFKNNNDAIYASKIDGVTDLFTVGGDICRFEKSDFNDRYFDWFTENVTKEMFENIYKKIGVSFDEEERTF